MQRWWNAFIIFPKVCRKKRSTQLDFELKGKFENNQKHILLLALEHENILKSHMNTLKKFIDQMGRYILHHRMTSIY